MPISVKDYEYAESETAFTVKFDWLGVKKENLSVAVATKYVKINCKPYFWEVFLLNEIDAEKSIVRIGEGQILVILVKQNTGLWGYLSHPNSENKSYRNEKRLDAIEEIRRRVAQGSTRKKERAKEKDDFLIREILKQEENERKQIEFKKAVEKKRINQELETISQARPKSQNNSHENCKPVNNHDAKETMPPPIRQKGFIQVNFTPRHFPTAARESKLAEENEWVKQVVQSGVRNASTSTLDNDNDFSNEELNPEWLKEKGIKMFSIGNFPAAENAFTMAIEYYPNNPSFYSNRSACYLKLNKYNEAAEDASKALKLLTPAIEDNAEARMRCYVRRGTAYCAMNDREKGLQDYESALRLCPENKSLRCDVLNLSSKIKNSKSKFRSLVTTV